jgi:DNA (cytosine-5)-methyltransferase 1
LVGEFGRLVEEAMPELVTMENVPRIARSQIFLEFVHALKARGYWVDWRTCYGPAFGLPQHRRRLVLLASRLGPICVPEGHLTQAEFATVRSAIQYLPPIKHGETHADDPLHCARRLSALNIRRLEASRPGGTWADWPSELRAPCHKRATGSTFKNVYARMSWDEPSPTITTLANNFGAGRFGHPEQDRAISLREAALLQGFTRDYRFVKPGHRPQQAPVARLIGNAVPPPIGEAIGEALVEHANRLGWK